MKEDAESLFLRLWIPVHQQCDWRGSGVQLRVDEETAVGSDVVLSPLQRVHTAAKIRVGKSSTGRPVSSVEPLTVIGAAIIAPAGLR